MHVPQHGLRSQTPCLSGGHIMHIDCTAYSKSTDLAGWVEFPLKQALKRGCLLRVRVFLRRTGHAQKPTFRCPYKP